MERRAAIDLLRAESTAWAIEPAAFEGMLVFIARDDRPVLTSRQRGPACQRASQLCRLSAR